MKNKKGFETTFGLAGASIGMGITGKALGYAPLEGAGATTAQFVPMSANIHGAGMTVGMLKDLKKKFK